MTGVTKALAEMVSSVVSFVVMIVLAIISFFFTVFVVDMGARLAEVGDPSADFVVLAAALLIAASIVAGGISPVAYLGSSSPSATSEETTASAD